MASGSNAAVQAVVRDPARVVIAAAERGATGPQGEQGPQGPPGVAGSVLSQLGDVMILSPTSNDLLAYNSVLQMWVNRPESLVTDGGNF